MTVASVDIDAEIIPVGVADDGQMELPENPDTIGWYRYGPSVPADKGSTVLAAHVDSIEFGVGQLARLHQAEKGDEISVTASTGDEVSYTVSAVRSVPKLDVPLTQLFARTGEPRLVMVTCGGEFDPESGGYEENVIVTAVPS